MKNIDIKPYLEKHGFGQFCPKAVLFDMDGVIYDSMHHHAVCWHQAMGDLGLDMPHEGAYEYEGMRGVEVIKMLAREQWHEELSDEKAATMYAYKSKLYAQLGPSNLMAGIVTLMQQIKADGLKICVVTGSGQHSMLERLEHDLPGLVTKELMVTAFDVTRGKPNPEPYIKGMEKCSVQPWETIVVENAPLGVQAAVGAHCFTIAVNTGPLPDKMLQDAGADLILPTMQMLSDYWYTLLSAVRL